MRLLLPVPAAMQKLPCMSCCAVHAEMLPSAPTALACCRHSPLTLPCTHLLILPPSPTAKVLSSQQEAQSLWQQHDYKAFSPSTDWDNVDWASAPAIQEPPVVSAICEPKPGAKVAASEGEVVLRGYAWSGGGKDIIRVDVSADGGERGWAGVAAAACESGMAAALGTYCTVSGLLLTARMPTVQQSCCSVHLLLRCCQHRVFTAAVTRQHLSHLLLPLLPAGKTWTAAKLHKLPQQPDRAWAWSLFEARLALPTGADPGQQVELVAKAVDASYNTQPDSVAAIWNLRGVVNNAWHRVPVQVVGDDE